MPRGPLTFRQRDVTAAVKAVADAGFAVISVEVDKTGKIVVHTHQSSHTSESAPTTAPALEENEWDAA